jgi:glucokinase
MSLHPVIEIGGTHVTAALVDAEAATVRWSERRPLDPHGPADAVLDAVAAPALGMPAPRGGGWSVAIPGPFDYANGIGDFTGIGKFWGLHGVDVRAGLAERLPRPVDRVGFVNDAEAFGVGEWALARPRPGRAVYLTLGTGVGSCYLDAGRAVRDHPGLPPEGLAHRLEWRGRPLEDWVSRRALIRDYAEASGREADVREIADLARAGDEGARRVFDGAYRTLGRALAPSILAFGAECVVVGGSIAQSWDLVGDPLRAGLGDAPELRRASGLEEAPIVGAAVALGAAADQEMARAVRAGGEGDPR